jgi:hypothetical protein
MNNEERALHSRYPFLQRVESAKRPTEITIDVPISRNPDFKLGSPSEGKGIWIEVKGHLRDKLWYKFLEHLPDKRLYKVVIVVSQKKPREQMMKRLDKIGIDYAYREVNPEWIAFATTLMCGGDSDDGLCD